MNPLDDGTYATKRANFWLHSLPSPAVYTSIALSILFMYLCEHDQKSKSSREQKKIAALRVLLD